MAREEKHADAEVMPCSGFLVTLPALSRAEPLCLDGFCIGQNITDARFGQVHWLKPTKNVTEQHCSSVGCQPDVAFRGYTPDVQQALADALRFTYGLPPYNIKGIGVRVGIPGLSASHALRQPTPQQRAVDRQRAQIVGLALRNRMMADYIRPTP
jgi:hypothetical protein